MKIVRGIGLVIVMLAGTAVARAGDTTVVENRVVIKVDQEQIKRDVRNKKNKITHFFLHTIGDPLKSTVRKVANAAN